jgi:broad specificity phosphatase PhoE
VSTNLKILYNKYKKEVTMKPQRIIFVRHGESEGNSDRMNYATTPDHALNLTKKGNEQAIQAGAEINQLIGDESIFSYVSPYARTRQTYNGIKSVLKDKIVAMVEDPRIREQDWGHMRHPDESDAFVEERKEFGTFFYRMKDGESCADVFDRTSTMLETMHRDFKKEDYPRNSLIVTHGMTLRVFLMRWLHWSVEEFENIRNPENCQVVVLEMDNCGKYKLTKELCKRDSLFYIKR